MVPRSDLADLAEPARPPGRRALRCALSLFAALLLVVALEFGLRAVGFQYEELRPPVLVFRGEFDAQMHRDDGLHCVDLDTIWSLRPGAPVEPGGAERINSLGLRGPEPSPADSVLRVASLGSSTSFGYGVAWDETFPVLASRALGRNGVPAEALLSGVVGHSVFQILERWRRDVRPLAPELAIVALNGLNEHFPSPSGGDVAHRRRVRAAYSGGDALGRRLRAEWRVLHLLDWVDDWRRGGREALVERWRAEQSRDEEAMARRGALDFDGERRVEPEAFGALLTELVGELRAAGVGVAVVATPRRATMDARLPILATYDAVLRERVEHLELPFLDAHAFFARLPDPTDALFLDEVHLTPLGHERLAEALLPVLFEALARRG